MPLSVTMIASVSERFSKLIDKNEYEPRLCVLMNQSKEIFPGKYERVEEQFSGQCDYVEVESGTKFDAKLPFTRKHGKLIGSNNHDFKKWLELMQKEESEFGEDIVASRGKNIASLELYKIMHERILSLEADENAVFFFPYPIVLDCKEFEFMHFTSDFLDAIFRELKRSKEIGTRNVYVIYPAFDGDIVLRCLNDNRREFLRYDGFDEFITYQFNP